MTIEQTAWTLEHLERVLRSQHGPLGPRVDDYFDFVKASQDIARALPDSVEPLLLQLANSLSPEAEDAKHILLTRAELWPERVGDWLISKLSSKPSCALLLAIAATGRRDLASKLTTDVSFDDLDEDAALAFVDAIGELGDIATLEIWSRRTDILPVVLEEIRLFLP